MNRRDALGRLGALMATGFAGPKLFAQGDSPTSATAAASAPAAGESFTIAHITDIHIFGERNAQAWFAKCLHTLQSHPDAPKLILNTGDCVMDSLPVDRAHADALWSIWQSTLKNDNSLPIHHVLGNHDHWGLNADKLPDLKNDPLFGKKLGMENLGLQKPYYSFDQGGWHFVAIDTILPTGLVEGPGWTSRLDDEQFEWLKADLKSTTKPVIVYSHVPIVQLCSMIYMKPKEDFSYTFHPGHMLGDARRVVDLFSKHPNVKLCLSGHMHLEDRLELAGVTYICDGSVCGAWWKGDRENSHPGFSLIKLHPDGTFDYKYNTYGWKALPADAKV